LSNFCKIDCLFVVVVIIIVTIYVLLAKVESVSAKCDKLEEDIMHQERHCDMKIDGIVPFPNSEDKRLVISLSRPILHTVEVKAKNLTCSECPRYNERGICAHTLAVVHQLGKLQEYTKSYQVPLANMSAPTIPNGAGKKENEKKSRSQEKVQQLASQHCKLWKYSRS